MAAPAPSSAVTSEPTDLAISVLLFGLGLRVGRGPGVYRAHRALAAGVPEPPQALPLASK